MWKKKKKTYYIFLKNLEALACQRAVQFAKEIGLTQFIFEGDSSTVIQAILEGSSDVLPNGHVIEDIHVQALDFQLFVFTHAPWKCNVVADVLAKKAKTCSGTQVWLEELPEEIASLACFDVHWCSFTFFKNKVPDTEGPFGMCV